MSYICDHLGFNCSTIAVAKGPAKECRCDRHENGGKVYLRVNCSSLQMTQIPNGDLPAITKLL